MLQLQEHSSPSYAPRTFTNATAAQLTVAAAVDFTTAGERLTRKMAGQRYIALELGGDPIEAARGLYRAMRVHRASKLNIAGNGIYTLDQHGWDQQAVNAWLYQVISTVHQHLPVAHIRSGGQTGADLAGLVVGFALGIRTLGYFPKGFIQRGVDKIDREQEPSELRRRIEVYAASLVNQPRRQGGVE